MSNSVCVSCEDTFPNIKLNRCQSCSEKQDNAAVVEFLCEDCVIAHIRKGHTVVDSKGNEPLTCSKHSLICTEYCATCDVPFCLKCIGNHSDHKFQSVDEKASEVKAKVFEILEELEMKEKPLRLKQKANADVYSQNKQLVHDLKEMVKEECKKLEEHLLRKIDEKLELNNDLSSELKSIYEKLLDLQKMTRELLSQSNPRLLKDIVATAKNVQNFEPIYNDSIVKESKVFSCDFGDARKVFEDIGDTFEQLIKTSRGEVFYLAGFAGSVIFRVEIVHQCEIKVSTLSVSKNGVQSSNGPGCVERLTGNVEITHVFDCAYVGYLIILLKDKSAKKIFSSKSPF
ncbi:transcription intermediary factor 1-alpha-like [Symsagittifera roscoffensis]|uniref:transcription intermediary factor 1-alpha-like n=1 Tax=Symsagittifera roscoffensis TaxID=84072 RepID=UPI00307BE376